MNPIDSTSTQEERMSTLLSSHLAHYNREILGEEHVISIGWIMTGFVVFLAILIAGFLYLIF